MNDESKKRNKFGYTKKYTNNKMKLKQTKRRLKLSERGNHENNCKQQLFTTKKGKKDSGLTK